MATKFIIWVWDVKTGDYTTPLSNRYDTREEAKSDATMLTEKAYIVSEIEEEEV